MSGDTQTCILLPLCRIYGSVLHYWNSQNNTELLGTTIHSITKQISLPQMHIR